MVAFLQHVEDETFLDELPTLAGGREAARPGPQVRGRWEQMFNGLLPWQRSRGRGRMGGRHDP
jgi:hypothetical protein